MLLVSLLARVHYRKDQQEWFKFDEEPDALPDDVEAAPGSDGLAGSVSHASQHGSSYGTMGGS